MHLEFQGRPLCNRELVDSVEKYCPCPHPSTNFYVYCLFTYTADMVWTRQMPAQTTVGYL